MPNVYKSNDVVLGEKKELEIKIVYPSNIIKAAEPLEEPETIEEVTIQLEAMKKQKAEILAEAEKERDQMIAQAANEARQIVEEAYQDSQKIFDDTRKRAYEEGHMAGKQDGYQAMEAIIQEAADIKKQTLEEKKTVAKELEKEMIQLVMAGVKKVIDLELETDPGLLLNLIRDGLEKSTFTETLVVKVSQADFEMVQASKNKIYMMTEGIESLEIKVDAAMSKGSIIIETLSGTIDASLDVQINTVESLFNELLRNE